MTGTQAVVSQQNYHNSNQNIIHDVFMNLTIFFSNTGFASGPRGYAAVVQMNILPNSDALNDIHLTDLSPCTAWFA